MTPERLKKQSGEVPTTETLNITVGQETCRVERLGNICCLPVNIRPDSSNIREIADGLESSHRPAYVLDFVLSDVNTATSLEVDGELLGFYWPNLDVYNIDHHAPDPRMARSVSTTPLVAELIRRNLLPKEALIMIHHYDADSILAAAITAGLIQPEERFIEAAIAADHTGVANDIADALTALESLQDPVYSFDIAQKLARGTPLPAEALAAKTQRENQREQVRAWALAGNLTRSSEGIYFAETELSGIRTEFLSGLPELSDAIAFVVSYVKPTGRAVKIRLGQAGMAMGIQLNDPHLKLPNFGGRWNAGGTDRQGPNSVPVNTYVGILVEYIRNHTDKD